MDDKLRAGDKLDFDSVTETPAQREAAARILREKALKVYQDSYKSENPTISAAEWAKYHTAWQRYYQNYYGSYYQKAAMQFVENNRKLVAPSPEQTKERILASAGAKVRKSRHFMPLLIGLSVIGAGLLLEYHPRLVAPIMAYVAPVRMTEGTIQEIDPTVNAVISADPKLLIPKLNIEAPVVFGFDNSVTAMNQAMHHGVAHFRVIGASAYPGELGNFVLTGHSSGLVYGTSPFKFIFASLERLEVGDLVYVNYERVRYTYRIYDKKVTTPSDVASLQLGIDKRRLTLITCVPIGTDRDRLLVFAEQISPAATDDRTQEDSTAEAKPPEMPTVEIIGPFQQFFNWLFGGGR